MTTRRRGHRRLGTREIAEVVRLLVGERPSRRLIDALFQRTRGDPRKLLVHLLVACAEQADLSAALDQLVNEALPPS
jgi:hypothetical protein